MKQIIISNGEIKLPNENVTFDTNDILLILEELWNENAELRAKCFKREEELKTCDVENRLTQFMKCG